MSRLGCHTLLLTWISRSIMSFIFSFLPLSFIVCVPIRSLLSLDCCKNSHLTVPSPPPLVCRPIHYSHLSFVPPLVSPPFLLLPLLQPSSLLPLPNPITDPIKRGEEHKARVTGISREGEGEGRHTKRSDSLRVSSWSGGESKNNCSQPARTHTVAGPNFIWNLNNIWQPWMQWWGWSSM